MATVVVKVLLCSPMACQVTPTPEVGAQLTLETTGSSEKREFYLAQSTESGAQEGLKNSGVNKWAHGATLKHFESRQQSHGGLTNLDFSTFSLSSRIEKAPEITYLL